MAMAMGMGMGRISGTSEVHATHHKRDKSDEKNNKFDTCITELKRQLVSASADPALQITALQRAFYEIPEKVNDFYFESPNRKKTMNIDRYYICHGIRNLAILYPHLAAVMTDQLKVSAPLLRGTPESTEAQNLVDLCTVLTTHGEAINLMSRNGSALLAEHRDDDSNFRDRISKHLRLLDRFMDPSSFQYKIQVINTRTQFKLLLDGVLQDIRDQSDQEAFRFAFTLAWIETGLVSPGTLQTLRDSKTAAAAPVASQTAAAAAAPPVSAPPPPTAVAPAPPVRSDHSAPPPAPLPNDPFIEGIIQDPSSAGNSIRDLGMREFGEFKARLTEVLSKPEFKVALDNIKTINTSTNFRILLTKCEEKLIDSHLRPLFRDGFTRVWVKFELYVPPSAAAAAPAVGMPGVPATGHMQPPPTAMVHPPQSPTAPQSPAAPPPRSVAQPYYTPAPGGMVFYTASQAAEAAGRTPRDPAGTPPTPSHPAGAAAAAASSPLRPDLGTCVFVRGSDPVDWRRLPPGARYLPVVHLAPLAAAAAPPGAPFTPPPIAVPPPPQPPVAHAYPSAPGGTPGAPADYPPAGHTHTHPPAVCGPLPRRVVVGSAPRWGEAVCGPLPRRVVVGSAPTPPLVPPTPSTQTAENPHSALTEALPRAYASRRPTESGSIQSEDPSSTIGTYQFYTNPNILIIQCIFSSEEPLSTQILGRINGLVFKSTKLDSNHPIVIQFITDNSNGLRIEERLPNFLKTFSRFPYRWYPPDVPGVVFVILPTGQTLERAGFQNPKSQWP